MFVAGSCRQVSIKISGRHILRAKDSFIQGCYATLAASPPAKTTSIKTSSVQTIYPIMKDSGFPAPKWELLAAAAAPPILTFDEPSLELISRTPAANADNSSAPRLGHHPIGDVCSPEGQWNCMTTSWQRCASGMWSAVVPCATGTICQPFGLTDHITIEYEATASEGHAEDAGPSSDDRNRGRKKSRGLRNSPSLVLLLLAAFTAGIGRTLV